MKITDMICQAAEVLTAIKKCQCLYHYCDNRHLIYRYIIKEIYRINKVDVLLEFLADDLREDCCLDDLRNELLKLYRILVNEFISKIKSFSYCVELAC